jgi:hypothetical protein
MGLSIQSGDGVVSASIRTFQRRDEIINGDLRHQHEKTHAYHDQMGVEYRAHNGSSPTDQIREQAEVIGFEKWDVLGR